MENQEIKGELIKMAPPSIVSSAQILGLTLSEWVLFTTLIYTLVQTGWLLYKIFRHFKGGK